MRHASTSNTRLGSGLVIAAALAGVAFPAAAQLSLQQALLSRTNDAPAVRNAIASEQAAAPQAPTTTEDALHALAQEADVIFAGEVLAIHHDAGAVRVEWRVMQGLLGVQAGENFTLREWPGLWANDDARYRIGQRALILLHAASAAGFRSPVGGQDGILPLNGDLVGGTADLRWIATRNTRSALAPIAPAVPVATAASGASAAPVAPSRRSPGPLPVPALSSNVIPAPATPATLKPAPTPVVFVNLQAIDAALVAGLLRTWSQRSAQ